METKINGLLIIEKEYSGTKSEADYAYLLASDDVRYRLYRPGNSDANDDYFSSYANLHVEVVGEVETGGYLAVSSISVQESSEENIEESRNEEVL